jgi:hypothetical protein
MTKSLCVFLLIFGAIPAFAYEPSEGNITATFGPYFSKTNFAGSNSGATAPVFRGLGLVALGDIDNKGSLEIAIFYTPKVFIREQAGQFISEQTDLVHVGMGYHYWINGTISTSLDFVTTYTTGDAVVTHNDFPIGQDMDTSARDITEYGFDFSVQWQLWESDRLGAVLDGRYTHYITKKADEISDDFGLLIGIRYVVQEKELEPPTPAESTLKNKRKDNKKPLTR